jgi:hypothetical protein
MFREIQGWWSFRRESVVRFWTIANGARASHTEALKYESLHKHPVHNREDL